jgi:hypothetical protein
MNPRYTRIVMVGIVAIAAAAAGGIALAGRGGAPPAGTGFDQVSNVGTAVAAVSQHDAQTLRSGGAASASLRLLGTRGNAVFYSAPGARKGLCYATGAASSGHIALLACPSGIARTPSPTFPSREAPILDMSASVYNSQSNVTRVVELEGFAVDGVANVELVDANGTAHVAPVVSNLYHLDLGKGINATALVALDRSGAELFRAALTRP